MESRLLMVDSENSIELFKALASEARLAILKLINNQKLSVNEIASKLNLPQSTVSTNISILEKSGMIKVESSAGKRGSQKLCYIPYDEIVIELPSIKKAVTDNVIEVSMPIGLYTDFEVSPPCGLCSQEEIIGYLDTPDTFFNPKRAVAGLIWFERGFVEYKFPNNLPVKSELDKLEVSMELSSEAPGTNKDWPSDITVWINGIEIGTWISPGDYGDVRGKLTPSWWKLAGSQYGLLKQWSVTESGSFVDGIQISKVTLNDLNIRGHSSLKLRIGLKKEAKNIGGLNIFGKGFGNYDQDIVMKMYIK